MRDGRIRRDVFHKSPISAHAALAELPAADDEAGPPSSQVAP